MYREGCNSELVSFEPRRLRGEVKEMNKGTDARSQEKTENDFVARERLCEWSEEDKEDKDRGENLAIDCSTKHPAVGELVSARKI